MVLTGNNSHNMYISTFLIFFQYFLKINGVIINVYIYRAFEEA